MERKFKRGFRVEILSRKSDPKSKGDWENTSVGCDAIIMESIVETCNDSDYDTTAPLYQILILLKDGRTRSLHWFEEKYLELVCCNEEKGLAILKQNLLSRA